MKSAKGSMATEAWELKRDGWMEWMAFIDPRDHQRYKRPAGEAREGRNGQQRTGEARQGKVERSH
jgi:hypothetical protein